MNGTQIRSRWRHQLTSLLPGQLVVQMTDRCNAACPQCSMRKTNRFKRCSLDQETLFRLIDAAGKKRIKAISFTGGEPMLNTELLLECIWRAGQNKIPFIRTGTNGFLFKGSRHPGFEDRINRLAARLAASPVRNFWISIDSAYPEIHESMRGLPGVTRGIVKALPLFHEKGIYPSVNLGINRNVGGPLTRDLDARDFTSARAYESALYSAYSRSFSLFFEQILDMGFTIANACYPMSIETDDKNLSAVYQASTTDRVIRYSKSEKAVIYAALMAAIQKYRHRLRIFSPLSSLHALSNACRGKMNVSAPCQGGLNYFFIDAQSGNTFPCGYRGQENLGKLWDLSIPPKTGISQCRRCDWECFRDPSELSSPFLDLLSAPDQMLKKMILDFGNYQNWATDLLYYRACSFFNGKIPPDEKKLQRFKLYQNPDPRPTPRPLKA